MKYSVSKVNPGMDTERELVDDTNNEMYAAIMKCMETNKNFNEQ